MDEPLSGRQSEVPSPASRAAPQGEELRLRARPLQVSSRRQSPRMGSPLDEPATECESEEQLKHAAISTTGRSITVSHINRWA
jgi:hypothetical protein